MGLCFTIWMYLYLLDKIETRTVRLTKKKLCRCSSQLRLSHHFPICLHRVRSLLAHSTRFTWFFIYFVYRINWNCTGLALMGKELGCMLSRVGNWLNRSPLCCLSYTHKSPRENRERCVYCELRIRFAELGAGRHQCGGGDSKWKMVIFLFRGDQFCKSRSQTLARNTHAHTHIYTLAFSDTLCKCACANSFSMSKFSPSFDPLLCCFLFFHPFSKRCSGVGVDGVHRLSSSRVWVGW